MNTKSVPLIFNIHNFALDDGQGIRTTVFLKGCPLSCVWCHNPESINPDKEITFYPGLCIGCSQCMTVCNEGAVTLTGNVHRIIRTRCIVCGECTKVCPSTALKTTGRYYMPEELIDTLLSDRIFYDTSGGGITFSGGEPTLFMDYVSNVMKGLKKEGVNIAIQTSGAFSLSEFRKKLLPYIDTIYYDIKFFDSHFHKCYTGGDNEQILNNFRELCKKSSVSVIATIPLVPEITATEDNLNKIAYFLDSAGCSKYELKPYNPGGIVKKGMLGELRKDYL